MIDMTGVATAGKRIGTSDFRNEEGSWTRLGDDEWWLAAEYMKVLNEPPELGGSGVVWYFKTPTGLAGCLRHHRVIEHEDGTITVQESIQVHAGDRGSWHGYLVKGIWIEA